MKKKASPVAKLPNPRPRPLSPHLQVYRFQITMALSILHRITGVGLLLGAFLLAGWVIALAFSEECFNQMHDLILTIPARIILFLFSLTLVYHMLNGIRHMVWDVGYGFEIRNFTRSGIAVVLLAFILTALIWGAAYGL